MGQRVSLLAIVGSDYLMAFSFQPSAQQIPICFIIFNYQDLWHVRFSFYVSFREHGIEPWYFDTGTKCLDAQSCSNKSYGISHADDLGIPMLPLHRSLVPSLAQRWTPL